MIPPPGLASLYQTPVQSAGSDRHVLHWKIGQAIQFLDRGREIGIAEEDSVPAASVKSGPDRSTFSSVRCVPDDVPLDARGSWYALSHIIGLVR